MVPRGQRRPPSDVALREDEDGRAGFVHSIKKFNCDFHREALQCDWVELISEGGGPHTEFARMIDGTVEGAVPEDLVYSLVKSNCEDLPCDLMEPILRDEGLHTDVVRIIGGTVQNKEPENTVHSIADFYGEALP